MRTLLPLFLLVACDDSTDTKPSGDDTAIDTDDGDDTAAPPTDDDHDGVNSLTDCDDNDGTVFPGAFEECDGVDNDCDGDVDENYDADYDGYTNPDYCDDGTDCDESNGSIHPDADEVPYDGVDQDCDGEDLVDVDGDTFIGEEAEGNDCDDDDPTINPRGDDIAHDGIDQDCDGADNLDGDGDGYDNVDWGGDDCDDSNATIYPGAEEISADGIDQDCDGIDLVDGDADGYTDASVGGDDCDDSDASVHPGADETPFDGIDSDCDGIDDGDVSLRDATITIDGRWGSQDILGYQLKACDLNDDGLDDLIVTAPFASSYYGQIGIFWGSGYSTWTSAMVMGDADVLIEGDQMFMGFGLVCDDIDGDGSTDLVSGRGEIDYLTAYQSDFGVLVWYGPADDWSSTLSDSDADVELSFELGVTPDIPTVYSRSLTSGDLDGDGASEILINMSAAGASNQDHNEIWILPGDRYSGTGDLVDEIDSTISSDSYDSISIVRVTEDFDGDGEPDIFVGQSGFTTDAWDTADTAADPDWMGLASWITSWPDDGVSVSTAAYASYFGSGDQALGSRAYFADIDGDGTTDMLLGSWLEDSAATDGGAIYYMNGLSPLLTDMDMDPEVDADAKVSGDLDEAAFGSVLEAAADLNGDGFMEVLVTDPAAGASTQGMAWLLSGAALSGEALPGDVCLVTFTGEETGSLAGFSGTTGDFDGDGEPDIVLGAPYWGYSRSGMQTGRAYIYLSSDW